MNSAITTGQTMIRRFLCDFHPVTMTPFIRELEPRPREEVMKYSIPADHFPYPSLILPSSSSVRAGQTIARDAREVRENVVVSGAPAVAEASAGAVKSAYVPPHLRTKGALSGGGGGGGGGAVPEHHVAKAPEPAAPSAPAGYVPPHLRRKPATTETMTVTKTSSATSDGKKKKDEFPTLGGAVAAKPKKSMWSKETSFATIAATPAPEEEPEVETQATILMRENERLRQIMMAQNRQREIAKFDSMAVRENGGVAYGGGESDEEYGGGRGGGDDEGAYDDEDAENDKYYA